MLTDPELEAYEEMLIEKHLHNKKQKINFFKIFVVIVFLICLYFIFISNEKIDVFTFIFAFIFIRCIDYLF